MSAVETCADGLVLRLYIQANAHLVKFLAKQFRVAKSQVLIEKGELGRHKQVKIIAPQQIPTAVAALTE